MLMMNATVMHTDAATQDLFELRAHAVRPVVLVYFGIQSGLVPTRQDVQALEHLGH